MFIEIDFKAKRVSTTEASGENRATPIKNIKRADGMIYLQGAKRPETGRAACRGAGTASAAGDGGTRVGPFLEMPSENSSLANSSAPECIARIQGGAPKSPFGSSGLR